MDTFAEFPKLIDLQARPKYHLWVRFSDGVSGEVDLSDIAGKGVFKVWENDIPFESVTLSDELGVPTWGEDLEIDAHNLYLELIGKSYGQWREEQLEYAAH